MQKKGAGAGDLEDALEELLTLVERGHVTKSFTWLLDQLASHIVNE